MGSAVPNETATGWKETVPQAIEPLHVLRDFLCRWPEDNPKLVQKWVFPTTRRDCMRVSFRNIQRVESQVSSQYHDAIRTVLVDLPMNVVRVVSYLCLCYLHPHHKNISQQGRHLLMIKVYEGRAEAHCWFIPLKEVVAGYAQTSEVLKQGVSLNDVQLVETYDVSTVFALHMETFVVVNDGGRAHANTWGECNWCGGMALHALAQSEEAFEKSQMFAMVPDDEMPRLAAEKHEKREKRARRKANQKAKKDGGCPRTGRGGASGAGRGGGDGLGGPQGQPHPRARVARRGSCKRPAIATAPHRPAR